MGIEHDGLATDGLPCVMTSDGHAELWTFAGTALNAALARRPGPRLDCPVRSDACPFDIRHWSDSTAGLSPGSRPHGRNGRRPDGHRAAPGRRRAREIRAVLPAHLRIAMTSARAFDPDAMRAVLERRVVGVSLVE